ncbi:glyoxylase I 4 [Solanum lycopersicum]|uniref:glyoxylase I 4 n=1 Tax=Solanum lycopersicum TaxID=4081 RepID=UPI003748420D
MMKGNIGNPLGLTSLNHISRVCTSLEESIDFYKNILGFVPVRRPTSFNFNGAWLFGHGIGIHLLQLEDSEKLPKKTEINPKDNHMSFQCESIDGVEKKLIEMGIEYIKQLVEEGGKHVDQLFFHDPDGFMVEICNCDKLPIIPLVGDMVRSCSIHNLHTITSQMEYVPLNYIP